MFPLNGKFGTKEVTNRTASGVPSGVRLAPGPDGKANGSYEFNGACSSYIEFPNSDGGALDVHYSMTMLCCLFYDGKDGPVFDYVAGYAVHFWASHGKLFVTFNKRDNSPTAALLHTTLAGGWKFVGASYNRDSGEAQLWIDGVMVHTLNIGEGLELATQYSVRMGVRSGDVLKVF